MILLTSQLLFENSKTWNIKFTKMKYLLIVITFLLMSFNTDSISVNNKTAISIGDSHTANNSYGWQRILCIKTGLKLTNLAVKGKTTSWMFDMAKININKSFNYCFIYGGANDMFGDVKPEKAVDNIQKIVNICNSCGVEAVVITGFDPISCIPKNPIYAKRYADFQKMLIDRIKGAIIIDTRVVSIGDCDDDICHMKLSGHKKMAFCVIEKMNFKLLEEVKK